MAPIFEMEFFNGLVKPSLWNAYTGWGLDFTWPFLLRYPQRHIGVIDDVCMRHTQGAGEAKGDNNLYSVPAPYDEREEESRRAAEYGYYPSRAEAMGYDYRSVKALGQVETSLPGPSGSTGIGTDREGEGGKEGGDMAPSSGTGKIKGSFSDALSWMREEHGDAEKDEERVGLILRKKSLVAYSVVAVLATLVVVTLLAARKQRGRRYGGQRRSSPKHSMTGLV